MDARVPATAAFEEPKAPAGSLLLFFLATYAIMWVCFGTVAAALSAQAPLGRALILLGTYSPSFVALSLTLRSQGSDGVRNLLRRVIQGNVAPRWYLFAAGYMIAVKLLVALVHRLAVGAWPRFGDVSWPLVPLAIAFSTPFQAGEEVGWRGYAFPRLAQRFGLAGASILLGVIWGLWHLPQFFIRDGGSYGQSFPVFVLTVIPLSVAIAWLYTRTNGSLLLPMLLHSAVNNTTDFVPAGMSGAENPFTLHATPVAWLTVAVLWVFAVWFLTSMARSESRPAQARSV